MVFDKLPTKSTARDDIIDQIICKIKSGHIRLNDKLPSERDLALMFGVSRATVREALKSMNALGLLEVRHGGGTFIRLPELEAVKKQLEWSLYLNPAPISELVELRSLLELHMAEQAALHRTSEDIQQMQQAIDWMRESASHPEQSKKGDLMFHLAVARSSGNKLMAYLLEVTRLSLEEWFEQVLSIPEFVQQSVVEHTSILTAIQERDQVAAREEMRKHLESAEWRLRSVQDD
ncbi:MAG: FadR family transcriptional regulator [Alicyclobacillus macrosporangiidus]|uniref:FadR/GntR family transcriptional regulator n=1 Tax=Alicyclobacillus macrosporangiidus TaxID=392015 RepID=UPI0026F1A963|nr:FadR/GntR family transcriptional regulator [Alicyclobacillus macrosporangiidus]MCL6597606.1 FadR family transcriptional regulator [Alicyclobacillus macrosporangiidus]